MEDPDTHSTANSSPSSDRSAAAPTPLAGTRPLGLGQAGEVSQQTPIPEGTVPRTPIQNALKVFAAVLMSLIAMLIYSYAIPHYDTVSMIYSVYPYVGGLGAFVVGVIAARETLHRLKNPKMYTPGKFQPYNPLIIFCVMATLMFPPLAILLIIAIFIVRRKKKQPIDPNPASSIKTFLLVALTFVSVAGSMAIAVFITTIWLSIRVCELSGSSKCF